MVAFTATLAPATPTSASLPASISKRNFSTRLTPPPFSKKNSPRLTTNARPSCSARTQIHTSRSRKHYKVTRSLLEVLLRHKHPVTITTKGALVARDVDLLAELARDGLTRVMFSIPTLDNEMKRVLEPRAASAAAKLKAMRVLAEAGVPVGVLVAPIIPVLTEHEIESVLEASREAGASLAGYTLLRLPWEVKDLFREWLAQHFPERAAHVMSIVRSMRGERDNDPAFGTRMHATGPGRAAHSPAFPARLPKARLSPGAARTANFAGDESFSAATTYSPSVVAGFDAVSSWSHV